MALMQLHVRKVGSNACLNARQHASAGWQARALFSSDLVCDGIWERSTLGTDGCLSTRFNGSTQQAGHHLVAQRALNPEKV